MVFVSSSVNAFATNIYQRSNQPPSLSLWPSKTSPGSNAMPNPDTTCNLPSTQCHYRFDRDKQAFFCGGGTSHRNIKVGKVRTFLVNKNSPSNIKHVTPDKHIDLSSNLDRSTAAAIPACRVFRTTIPLRPFLHWRTHYCGSFIWKAAHPRQVWSTHNSRILESGYRLFDLK